MSEPLTEYATAKNPTSNATPGWGCFTFRHFHIALAATVAAGQLGHMTAYKPRTKHKAATERSTRPPSSHQIEREIRQLRRMRKGGDPTSVVIDAVLDALLWTQGHSDDHTPTETAKRAGEMYADGVKLGVNVIEAIQAMPDRGESVVAGNFGGKVVRIKISGV